MKIVKHAAIGLAGATLAAMLGSSAFADRPSAISSVCLDGGRSAAVCACAEEKLQGLLPAEDFADYEAVAETRLADPSGNPTLTAAAETVAAQKGVSLDELRTEIANAVQMHRQFMRDCN
ncbi:MAG: hypothetical protein AAGM38_04380 [Pseudomonadota bacterium]